MPKARYVMVGGFLGAGKTTALLRLAERLKGQGLRVGLITNDQSVGLVDTALLQSHALPVEEITGGCFCCRFTSLTTAAEKLTASDRPDVFLAEPVGSCTDLTATVSYPLRRMYGDAFSIAPYSVLVDPARAERVLGLAEGKSFSPKVLYIYLKQLEEAEVIVVNKADLLDAGRLAALKSTLETRFPQARVLAMSARTGDNVEEWAGLIEAGDLGAGDSIEVDYDTYAEGEAELGWVNLTAVLTAESFDGNEFLMTLAADLHARLAAAGVEVAHLKMTLSPDEGSDLGVINLVSSDGRPEMSHALQEPLGAGTLILNLRAEADPQQLRAAAEGSLKGVTAAAAIAFDVEHAEAFRPGRPVPTHRETKG
jgi:Ni2+-binding GTPase involved in maturation of urease and hydrogenase